ncbi:pirin family protein [Kitasatospora sp. Ki12]
MSNLDLKPTPTVCGREAGGGPVKDLLTPRHVQLGESTVVRRLLPNLGRRMVGAWCFVEVHTL